jgi:hypothetical protein
MSAIGRPHAAAVVLAVALLCSSPAVAQIERVTIGVDGMT